MDFVGLALDWCSIDFGLPLDYIEISAHQLPSDTGLATHNRWINIKLVTNSIGNRQSDGLSLDWCQRDICKKVKTFNITLTDKGFPSVNVGWMWDFWKSEFLIYFLVQKSWYVKFMHRVVGGGGGWSCCGVVVASHRFQIAFFQIKSISWFSYFSDKNGTSQLSLFGHSWKKKELLEPNGKVW